MVSDCERSGDVCLDLCLSSCTVLSNRASVETHSFLTLWPDFRSGTADCSTAIRNEVTTHKHQQLCELINVRVFSSGRYYSNLSLA